MRSALKPLRTAAFCAGLFLPLGCNSVHETAGFHFDYQGQEAARSESGGLASGLERLEVQHGFGVVVIEGTEDSPSWSWELTTWATGLQTAERYLDLVELHITDEGGESRWELEIPESAKEELRGVRSNLTLRVPAGVEVEVENSFGETELRRLDGDVRVRSDYGGLTLADLGGPVEARAEFGGLTADGLSGDCRLATAYGAMKVTRLTSPSVTIESSFGDVSLEGEPLEVSCHNQYGATKLVLAHPGTRSVEAESHFGDLVVEIPAGSRPRVQAQASFGSVDSDVGFSDSWEGPVGARASSSPEGASLTLDLRASYGDIRVRRG